MKTSEMIAMLEKNPGLKFRRPGYITDKCLCVIDGRIKWNFTKDSPNIGFHDDWQLVREPVQAWEAVKAFTEGKTIACEGLACRQRRCTFNRDKNIGTFCMDQGILGGTWYIEEPANG
jgi:hypothetical protein